MILPVQAEDYGPEWAGEYSIRMINWREGRELLRKTIKSKDPTDYIEELILATCIDPEGKSVNKAILEGMPSGLVRRLMDETLKLNDISRQEANFLQTSPIAGPHISPKTNTSK